MDKLVLKHFTAQLNRCGYKQSRTCDLYFFLQVNETKTIVRIGVEEDFPSNYYYIGNSGDFPIAKEKGDK